MSTQSSSSNTYSVYKQNVQKYFENISKLTPQYFQSVTDLQKECVKACEKTINSVVSIHEEFVKKTGMEFEIPTFAKTSIVDTNKQIVQASTIGNQFVITTIDTAVENIKTHNENMSAFAELNKNIVDSWTTLFSLKN